MRIYFRTKKLGKECSSLQAMQRRHGQKGAARLAQRLMELAATENLAQISHLPPARCHELSGNRAGCFSVDLDHPFRLIFIPANDPVPCLVDGGVDLKRVTEVEIIEIVDTHK